MQVEQKTDRRKQNRVAKQVFENFCRVFHTESPVEAAQKFFELMSSNADIIRKHFKPAWLSLSPQMDANMMKVASNLQRWFTNSQSKCQSHYRTEMIQQLLEGVSTAEALKMGVSQNQLKKARSHPVTNDIALQSYKRNTTKQRVSKEETLMTIEWLQHHMKSVKHPERGEQWLIERSRFGTYVLYVKEFPMIYARLVRQYPMLRFRGNASVDSWTNKLTVLQRNIEMAIYKHPKVACALPRSEWQAILEDPDLKLVPRTYNTFYDMLQLKKRGTSTTGLHIHFIKLPYACGICVNSDKDLLLFDIFTKEIVACYQEYTCADGSIAQLIQIVGELQNLSGDENTRKEQEKALQQRLSFCLKIDFNEEAVNKAIGEFEAIKTKLTEEMLQLGENEKYYRRRKHLILLHREQYLVQRDHIKWLSTQLKQGEALVYQDFSSSYDKLRTTRNRTVNLIFSIVEMGPYGRITIRYLCNIVTHKDFTKEDSYYVADVWDHHLRKDGKGSDEFKNIHKIIRTGDSGSHFHCFSTIFFESHIQEKYGIEFSTHTLCKRHAYNMCDSIGSICKAVVEETELLTHTTNADAEAICVMINTKTKFHAYRFGEINRHSSLFGKAKAMPGIQTKCEFQYYVHTFDGAKEYIPGYVLAKDVSGKAEERYVLYDLVADRGWGPMCPKCADFYLRPAYHETDGTTCPCPKDFQPRKKQGHLKCSEGHGVNLNQPSVSRIMETIANADPEATAAGASKRKKNKVAKMKKLGREIDSVHVVEVQYLLALLSALHILRFCSRCLAVEFGDMCCVGS